MVYNHGSGSRKLVVCALVVIGLLGGLVLIGCGSGGSNGATPLEFSYELLGDELTVDVMVSGGASIDEDIVVAITLTPAGREAFTGMVTVAQATGSGTITFMGASGGTYELVASSSASIRIVGDTAFELLETLQVSDADTDNSIIGNGDASFSLALDRPARDAYKISLVDTGAPADSAANLALAISDPDGADQGSSGSRRLYRDAAGTKTLGATVPTTPNDFTDGLIYTFLPGDDGADAPARGPQDSSAYYELIWRDDTNTKPVAYPSQLAAATDYTLTITAENSVNWRLRAELHDLPRLPANIATTFRGTDDGNTLGGTGFYLVYNPTSGASRITLQLERAAESEIAAGLFAAGETIAIRTYVGDQDGCTTDAAVSATSTLFQFSRVAELLERPTQVIASINQPIYCVQFKTESAAIAEVSAIAASNPDTAFGRRSGHFVFTLLSEAAE